MSKELAQNEFKLLLALYKTLQKKGRLYLDLPYYFSSWFSENLQKTAYQLA